MYILHMFNPEYKPETTDNTRSRSVALFGVIDLFNAADLSHRQRSSATHGGLDEADTSFHTSNKSHGNAP